MRKRWTAWLCTFILVFSMVQTVPAQIVPELQEVLNEVNEKNRKIDAPADSLSQYEYPFQESKELFTMEDRMLIKDYDSSVPPAKTISTDEARKEAEWLFRLLRTQYGLYTWFGGDAVFNQAKQDILAELEGDREITMDTYELILAKHLIFIEDTHFIIGNITFQPSVALFSNETKEFYYEDGKFYENENKENQVLSVNNQEPSRFIKRAIDQKGNLTWYLYTMKPKASSCSVTVTYSNKEETITLYPAIATVAESGKDYEYKIKNGIPFVSLPFMMFGEEDMSGGRIPAQEKEKQSFLRSASELKKFPFAVIDLRNNPGGNGTLPDEWFFAYTGQVLQSNFCTLRINSQREWADYALGGEKNREFWNEYMKQSGYTQIKDYFVIYPEKQFLSQKEQVLFVLMSRNTASSAEKMIDAVRNIENVVTIGSNTAGVLTNGANYQIALPYSGLRLQFGENLFYWDKDYFLEGRGLEPDLYLTGTNQEERFRLFLNQYTKEEKEAA